MLLIRRLTCQLPCLLKSQQCFLSTNKKLKQKIKQAKKSNKASELKINNDHKYVHKITQNQLYFQRQTFAMKYAISSRSQLIILGLSLAPCLFLIYSPFNDLFYYSLFAGQKISACILLANLNWTRFKALNFIIGGSIIGLQIFTPINYVESISLEIVQLLLFFSFGSQKYDQKQKLSEESKILLNDSIIMKLGIWVGLSFICLAKISYFYNTMKIEGQIKQLNSRSVSEQS